MALSKEKLIHVSNALELLRNTLKCAICLDLLREPVSTRCGHHFCNLCITNLLTHKKNGRASCPLCNSTINRRSIQANEKIKRQVETVVHLAKAVEADSKVDILHLKEAPHSTHEANSPDAVPAAIAGSRKGEAQQGKESQSKAVETVTPERSSSHKLSSAEKVKTWLLQNEEDFEHKGILNGCTDNLENPAPIEEDCDIDMVSVSQVVNESHMEISIQKKADEKIEKRPKLKTVRRSLNTQHSTQQNKKASLTKAEINEAFDKLLVNHQVHEGIDNKTSVQVHDSTVPQFQGSLEKDIGADSKIAMVVCKSMDAKVNFTPVDVPGETQQHTTDGISSINEEAKADAGKFSLQGNPNIEKFPQISSTGASKKLDICEETQTQQEPSSWQSSLPDSCDIIPPSIVAVQTASTGTPIPQRLTSNRVSEKMEVQIKSKKSSISARKSRATKPRNEKKLIVDPQNMSSENKKTGVSGTAFLKAGRIRQSEENNAKFIQRGRLIRERSYIPVDVRYYFCADKTVLLIDTSELNTPEVHSESTNDSTSARKSHKEYQSVSVQTSPCKVAGEICQVKDDSSQELFPASPHKVDSAAGEIYKRRSNNSVNAVDDAIMDAETVILTQRPAVLSAVTNSHQKSSAMSDDCAIVRSESDHEEHIQDIAPAAKNNLSESLLSRGTEVARKSGSEEEDDFPRVKKRRRTVIRSRKLSSSEESDSGVRKVRKKEKIKKKSPESERLSCPDVQDLLPGLFDQTLESPKRLVRGIKAKIEADMQGKFDGNANRRCSPRTPKNAKMADDLSTPPRKRTATFSDQSDIDILEGTPQRNMDTSRKGRKSARTSEKMFLQSARKSPSPAKQTISDPPVRDSSSPDFVESTPQVLSSRRLIEVSSQSLDVSDPVPTCKEDNLLHCSILDQTTRGLDVSELRSNGCDDTNFAKPASVPKKHAGASQRPLREINAATESLRSNIRPMHTDVQSNACPRTETMPAQSNSSKCLNSPRSENLLLKKNVGNNHLNVRLSSSSSLTTPAKNSTSAVATKQPTKLSFLCSGLGGDFPLQVKKFAEMVGAGFSTTFDPKVTTHLIVRAKDNGTTDKTLKYLQAVAAKKWVVSIRWIQEGVRQGKLLPEESFEVLDTSGLDGPRRSRLSPKSLFSNFEFCCFPPFSDLTKQQLEELIELCGGTVVSDPKKFSFKPDVLPLCLAQWDEEREQEYLGWMDRYCVPLVQHDWLMDCIGRFSVISFWSLLMSDVSDANLRTMGYPAELIEHPTSDSTEID